MNRTFRLVIVLLLVGLGRAASAQTVDEVIEQSLTAIGGRAALAKLKSRTTTGTITLSTPGGDIAGTVETFNTVPNKSRTVIKADLTALGAGMLVVDQRFDGTNGYIMDSLQGNRDMAGDQLANARNSSFPSPLLNYKNLGISAKLGGKEKVGDREAFVITFEPTTGPVVRQYFDTETHLPLKSVISLEVPQLGTTVEQTTEVSDFRDVDGVKLPFRVRSTSAVQSFVITLAKVEHNTTLDETMFSKPK